eukprot:m51a1_g9089 putative glycosyl hydrolase family 15 (348) ;mRNA; f:45613-47233
MRDKKLTIKAPRTVPFPRTNGVFECLDCHNHWYAAEIVSVHGDEFIVVHFDGLKPRWNEEIPLTDMHRFRKLIPSRARYGADANFKIKWSELPLLDLPDETSEDGEPIPEGLKSPVCAPVPNPLKKRSEVAKPEGAPKFPTQGAICECKDFAGNWYAAEIVQIVSDTIVVVHFDGMLPKWDEDIDIVRGIRRFRKFDASRAKCECNPSYKIDRSKPAMELPYDPDEDEGEARRRKERAREASNGPRTVTFRCICNTRFGETLFISGSHHKLGSWVPRRADMQYSRLTPGGHEWTLTLQLDRMPIEYKYVLVGARGTIEWESRTNRVLSATATETNDIFDKDTDLRDF